MFTKKTKEFVNKDEILGIDSKLDIPGFKTSTLAATDQTRVAAVPQRFYHPIARNLNNKMTIVIGMDTIANTVEAIQKLIEVDKVKYETLLSAVYAKDLFMEPFSKLSAVEKNVTLMSLIAQVDVHALVLPSLCRKFIEELLVGCAHLEFMDVVSGSVLEPQQDTPTIFNDASEQHKRKVKSISESIIKAADIDTQKEEESAEVTNDNN